MLITEYDLPKRTRQPHDVIVDSDGIVWYASFGEPILGKLDPKTGKTTEYPIPVLKPGHINGNLDLELDEDQNLWIAMTFQAGIAKFDRKTGNSGFTSCRRKWTATTASSLSSRPITAKSTARSGSTTPEPTRFCGSIVATGKFETFEPFPQPRPNIYEVTSDAQNNAYFTVMGRQDIGKIDAKTGKISIYPLPTQRSAPRRGTIDAQGRLWFGENRSNKIGMFDTKTQEVQEWAVPVPFYLPYDVTADKNGEAWAVTEFSDTVLRFDPKTGNSRTT